mgnify:CR=1 FL=1
MVTISRRSLLVSALGVCIGSVAVGCVAPTTGSVNPSPATDFFAGLFPDAEAARFVVRSNTVQELARSCGAVVEGKIRSVRHVASSFGDSGTDPIHTLGFDIAPTIVRGALPTGSATITIVGGTVATDPDEAVRRLTASLPDEHMLWFVTAHDDLAAQRRRELEANGEEPSDEALAEEAKLSGLFAAGPFGVVSQGPTHAELPYLSNAPAEFPLVSDVRGYRTLDEVRGAVRA